MARKLVGRRRKGDAPFPKGLPFSPSRRMGVTVATALYPKTSITLSRWLHKKTDIPEEPDRYAKQKKPAYNAGEETEH